MRSAPAILPGRFIAVFTIDGETRQDERMALCLLQAEVEFRYQLARTFERRAVLVSVRPAGIRFRELDLTVSGGSLPGGLPEFEWLIGRADPSRSENPG